jgi:hypothetical protein
MLSAVYAFYTDQIILGMLILAYCQMQLSEAMIWRGIDTDNLQLNKIGTTYGKYLLPSHNIGIGLGILVVALVAIKNGKKQKLEMTDWLPLLIGFTFFLFVIQCYYKDSKHEPHSFPANKSCMKRECQNNENRLLWPFPDTWYVASFILSIIFLIMYGQTNSSTLFLGLVFTLTWIISNSVFPVSRSSVWCFSAAILAPFIVVVNGILIKRV